MRDDGRRACGPGDARWQPNQEIGKRFEPYVHIRATRAARVVDYVLSLGAGPECVSAMRPGDLVGKLELIALIGESKGGIRSKTVQTGDADLG